MTVYLFVHRSTYKERGVDVIARTHTHSHSHTHTHTHTQLYGRLLFLLQATPEYIARLTRRVSLREIDGLLQVVMFTLYGNQYEDREEHLLLSMFEVS